MLSGTLSEISSGKRSRANGKLISSLWMGCVPTPDVLMMKEEKRFFFLFLKKEQKKQRLRQPVSLQRQQTPRETGFYYGVESVKGGGREEKKGEG